MQIRPTRKAFVSLVTVLVLAAIFAFQTGAVTSSPTARAQERGRAEGPCI